MAYRLVNIPMENDEFAAEKEYIYKVASINGYGKDFVDKIINRHKRIKYRQTITTLRPDRREIQRISVPFYPKVTNPIQNILKRHNFHVVYKSDKTLRQLLCNQKDKTPVDELSGIYRIKCNDCPSIYIGQSRRKLKIRLREHKNAVDNERVNESSVAAHSSSLGHTIDWDSATLIKSVRKSSNLNAWESMHIATANQPLMNEDEGPITSCLFPLTKLKL